MGCGCKKKKERMRLLLEKAKAEEVSKVNDNVKTVTSEVNEQIYVINSLQGILEQLKGINV